MTIWLTNGNRTYLINLRHRYDFLFDANIVMFVIISDITLEWAHANENMPIKRPHATLYLLAMFILSVTVCEIITFELPGVLNLIL